MVVNFEYWLTLIFFFSNFLMQWFPSWRKTAQNFRIETDIHQNNSDINLRTSASLICFLFFALYWVTFTCMKFLFSSFLTNRIEFLHPWVLKIQGWVLWFAFFAFVYVLIFVFININILTMHGLIAFPIYRFSKLLSTCKKCWTTVKLNHLSERRISIENMANFLDCNTPEKLKVHLRSLKFSYKFRSCYE